MARNIKARRALSDLFKKGVEIRFGSDPETGEPKGEVGPFLKEGTDERVPPRDDQVVAWVQPADPLQREEAVRQANAKRAASIVKAKRDKDSEEHLTAMAFLSDMDDETLIDYVIINDTSMRQAQAEREVLAYDEWKEMEAYQDAMRNYTALSPEDLEDNEEWQALLELDEKYGEQVREREGELRDAQRDTLRMQIGMDRQGIEDDALKKRAELASSSEFMHEYQRWMGYYAVRQFDDTTELFFDGVDDFWRQDTAIRECVNEALAPFIASEVEAKNSPRVVAGSASSAPPSEPETSASSTPEVVNA